jgi:hypothetical protein
LHPRTDTHHPHVALLEPVPTDVPVGADVVVRIAATCPAGCDLRGARAKVIEGDGVLATAELTGSDEGDPATGELAFQAPGRVGEHSLTIVVERHEIGGTTHEEVSHPLTIEGRPHGTSLAVWDLPTPAIVGRPFEVKIGARCAEGCRLHGREIAVYDETNTRVATGMLGVVPLPGTTALYWAEIPLPAPEREGVSAWAVGFDAAELELPHTAAASRFTVAAVRPPEHTVTVRVTAQETGEPLPDARVLLGPHRAVTDASGVARLEASSGAYMLHARKVGFQDSSVALEVTSDLSVEVAAAPEPEVDPFAEWM